MGDRQQPNQGTIIASAGEVATADDPQLQSGNGEQY
jgi:hypothetical protein